MVLSQDSPLDQVYKFLPLHFLLLTVIVEVLRDVKAMTGKKQAATAKVLRFGGMFGGYVSTIHLRILDFCVVSLQDITA